MIFGSHTHHHFDEGEMNNGVLMAGKYGYYLGEVNLTIENKKVVSKEAIIYPVETLPMVETDYESEGKALMSEPVIDYPINLNSKTDVITKTTYLLESVFEFTNTDCTIINLWFNCKRN